MSLLVHLGSTLQQARVEVEHITWVGLAPGRSAQQQRHLPISYSLLGQVIVEDHCMLAIVTEVLGHGTSSVRRQELQRRGIGGGRRNYGGVLQAVVLAQNLKQL